MIYIERMKMSIRKKITKRKTERRERDEEI